MFLPNKNITFKKNVILHGDVYIYSQVVAEKNVTIYGSLYIIKPTGKLTVKENLDIKGNLYIGY